MLEFSAFLLLVLGIGIALVQATTKLAHLKEHDTVFATRLTKDPTQISDTALFEDEEVWAITAFGKTYELELHRNHALIPRDYQTFVHTSDGIQVHSESDKIKSRRHCHFHGKVLDYNGKINRVAVSLCGGSLHGEIVMDDVEFFVEPHHHHYHKLHTKGLRDHCLENPMDSHLNCHDHHIHLSAKHRFKESEHWERRAVPHVAYQPHQIKPVEMKCGNHDHGEEDSHHFHGLSVGDSLKEVENIAAEQRENTDFEPLWAHDTKYVELMIVNDHARFLAAGSVANAENFAITLVNIVDSRYLNAKFTPAPVRVVLKYQVTMNTGNPWTLKQCSLNSAETDHDDLLADFLSYVENTLHSNPSLSFDNAQLLSSLDFCGGTVGYAPIGAMCYKPSSGGITQATFASQQTANIISHELGHNFNMLHDGGSNNNCDASKFIMASTGCLSCQSYSTSFSSCSKSYISKMFLNRPLECLSNEPESIFGDPVCGDGFVEDSEQCDCGSSDCSSIDPCCNGATCMFEELAECSNLDDCCNNCKIREASENYECRPEFDSTCDVAETCDGIGSKCPTDIFAVAPGTSCTSESGHSGRCHNGGCMSLNLQCDSLFVQSTGSCLFPSCSSPLYCLYQSQCYSFSVSVSDGTPCGTGQQCLDGGCVSSSVLEYFYDLKCSLSCDSEDVVEEVICRKWDGSEVASSFCSSAYPVATQRCSTFAPIVCEVNVTLSTTPLSAGDYIDIDWSVKGNIDFVTLVLSNEVSEWPLYIDFEVSPTHGTYRYTLNGSEIDGMHTVKVVVSSSSYNNSDAFQIDNTCTSGVDCDVDGGECTNGVCSCVEGFYGNECSQDECELLGYECLNGAECTDNACSCMTGYSGVFCQVESTCTQECPIEHTEPNAACTDCICAGGYGGNDCSSCSLSCSHGSVDSNCLFCTCEKYFTGTLCDKATAVLSFEFEGIAETALDSVAEKNEFASLLNHEIVYITGVNDSQVEIRASSITYSSGTFSLTGILISEDSSSTELEKQAKAIESEIAAPNSVKFRTESLIYVSAYSYSGNFPEDEDQSLYDAILAWIVDHIAFIIPAAVIVMFLLIYKFGFERSEKGHHVMAGAGEHAEPLLYKDTKTNEHGKETKKQRLKRRKEEFKKRKGKKKGKGFFWNTKARVDELDTEPLHALQGDFGVVEHDHDDQVQNIPQYHQDINDLPPNWTVQYYDNGDAFYFNSATNDCQSNRPGQ